MKMHNVIKYYRSYYCSMLPIGIATIAVIVFFSLKCFPNSSSNVTIGNHVYFELDRLIACGLIKDAIYSQRPWSRNEIARMIIQAKERYEESRNHANEQNISTMAMEHIIKELETEFREEFNKNYSRGFHLLDEVKTEAVFLDSPYRKVPENNGVKIIEASINPLVSYREGRRYADGGTLALESVHRAQITKYFSFYANPRFEGLLPNEVSSHSDVRAQAVYGKLSLGSLEIEAGRDSLIWGPGEYGGVLSSSNSRNLDMVKISNDSPVILPWIFAYLGPSKFTFAISNLGSSYILNNSYLYGFAAAFKPTSFLEIGIEHQITVGGKNAPDIDLGDLIREFLLYRKDMHNTNLTDHRVGVNIRTQIPQLHGAAIYVEGVYEDLGRESFWPQFTQQMGFLAGFHMPMLTADGSNDLRVEYEHIPAAYGRHYLWISGLSLDELLRGSELGPDGHGIHVTWGNNHYSGKRFKTEIHYERRDSNYYAETPSSLGGPNEVYMVSDRPLERRLRLKASMEWVPQKKFAVCPELGYERVWSFNFVPGMNRNNFLAAVSMKWYPGLWEK